ncbi:MAG: sodium/proline symporter [Pseudomonadota bacterium]
MQATLAVLGVYLLVLFVLAVWSRRATTSLSGLYLADKKLPFWVVAFSTNATGESAWLLLGLTGMAYATGVQALWVVLGEIVGIYLSWTLISRRLKRLADRENAITVPDVLAAPFEEKQDLIRIVAVAIILIMVTTYVTAQMVASGKALSTFVGMEYGHAVLVSSIVIIGYTFVGGYKAVSYTDVLQGVLMLAGLIVVPIVGIQAAGGWLAVLDSLRAQDPNLLRLFADGGVNQWVVAMSFVAIGLPFLGVPQLLVRYMSARDERELVKARSVSVVVLLLFTLGAVLAGMAGRALFPGLDDRETVFPLMASELFPPLVTGVLLVVVLSAIMSTVDSLLLLASSAVVRDGLQRLRKSPRTDAELARLGKLATVMIGLLGIAFALPEARFIFWFVLFSWSGLGAAFGPAILMILYDPKVSASGVLAGILGGFLTSVVWVLLIKEHALGLYEAIPGFAVGLVLAYIVSRLAPAQSAPDAAGQRRA